MANGRDGVSRPLAGEGWRRGRVRAISPTSGGSGVAARVQGGRRAGVSTARRLRPAADPRLRRGRAGSTPTPEASHVAAPRRSCACGDRHAVRQPEPGHPAVYTMPGARWTVDLRQSELQSLNSERPARDRRPSSETRCVHETLHHARNHLSLPSPSPSRPVIRRTTRQNSSHSTSRRTTRTSPKRRRSSTTRSRPSTSSSSRPI